MSRRNDATSLRQMLDHTREIRGLVEGRTLGDVRSDRKLQLSLLHLLSVLGEAAGRVSEGFRSEHPELPWREMTGTRNWLIHAYDRANLETVWRTSTEDIPRLVDDLERLLR
jgi:uncharacterized protein with HEPN domain